MAMSKGRKSKAAVDSVNWDEGLVKEQINDDKWQPFVMFLVPSDPASQPVVESLVSAIDAKSRRLFTSLNKEKLITIAKDDAKLATTSASGGGGRKSKQASAPVPKPLFVEVCQSVVSSLSGGDIPAPLVARLIKYVIIKSRVADLMAKDMTQKEPDEKPVKGPSAKAKGGPAAGRASKKGKVTPANEADKFPMPQKSSTTMKKRGEDAESQYIDDEPDPGPNSYVIITGFNDTEVLSQLTQVGVAVHVLVKVTTSSNIDVDSEENERLKSEVVKFWSNIDETVSSSVSGSSLRDIAMIEMISMCDTDDDKEFGTKIFSQLAKEAYDILHYQRQYGYYMHYLDLKSVPLNSTSHTELSDASSCTPEGEKIKQAVDMRYYNEKISKVPCDAINPSTILNCILDQVELSSSNNNIESPLDMNMYHPETLSFINGVFESLPSEADTEDSIDSIPVVHEEDYNRLACINATETFCAKHHPSLIALFTPPVLPPSINLSVQRDLHVLKQFLSTVPSFQIDSFISMCLAVLSMEHVMLPNVAEEPPVELLASNFKLVFDYPFDGLLESGSDNVSLPANKGDRPSLPEKCIDLSDYTVLEPLSQDVILQVIENHSKTHPYIQIYHQKITNSLVVAMHSGYSREATKSSWQRHIHSKVGFSNFLSYIVDRVGSAVEAAAVEDDALRNHVEEIPLDQNTETLTEKHETSLETPLPESKTSSAKSGSKKSGTSSAKVKPNGTVVVDDNVGIIPVSSFEERKLFTGYDVGDKVLLCNGSNASAFTFDGVKIKSERTQFTHEPASLLVSLIHNDICLSVSFSIESQSSTLLSCQESNDGLLDEETCEEHGCSTPNPMSHLPKSVLFSAFKGQLDSNITLSFSHFGPNGNGCLPVYPKSEPELQKLLQNQVLDSAQSSRPVSQDKKVSKKQQEEQQRLMEQQALDNKNKEILLQKVSSERKVLYSGNVHQKLSLSTENGLCVAFSTMTHDAAIGKVGSTVIRQHYLNSAPSSVAKEDSRVYFDDGCILKTMTDGSLSILCYDGKVYESVPNSVGESTREPNDIGNRVSFHNVQDVIDQNTWMITFPDGKREIITQKDNPSGDSSPNPPSCKAHESLRTFIITDPKTKDVLMTREDNVMILKKLNGCVIVEHADGTRITSTPSSSYIFQHPSFVAVCYEGTHCRLNLSNIEIVSYSNGQYSISSKHKGYSLSIDESGKVEYILGQSIYTLCHDNIDKVLSATDIAGVTYGVNSSGNISIEGNDTSCDSSPSKIFLPRFFLIFGDGQGFEVHNSSRVKEMVSRAHQCDKVLVIEEEFKECPQCYSTLLLSALFNKNQCFSDMESVIPKSFVATLHSDSTKVGKVTGKKFGVNVGKSLNVHSESVEFVPKHQKHCGYKQRQFIQINDATLFETFKACLLKFLKWKHNLFSTNESVLPTIPNNMVTANLQPSFNLLLSPESLMKHYKNVWEASNTSFPLQNKESDYVFACKSISESSRDAKELKKKILRKHYLPYFQSTVGLEFLQSISERGSINPEEADVTLQPPLTVTVSDDDKDLVSLGMKCQQSIIVKGKSSGFKVTPERINFGTVKEGYSYSAHCSLRNVGITASQFAIKSLPASTGIKVIYTPSSVIPGMATNFTVELIALMDLNSKNSVFYKYHELEIQTDTGIVYLPIEACIQH